MEKKESTWVVKAVNLLEVFDNENKRKRNEFCFG